jgi:NADH/NAD ratio-sensing transcriptional regulator Rex
MNELIATLTRMASDEAAKAIANDTDGVGKTIDGITIDKLETFIEGIDVAVSILGITVVAGLQKRAKRVLEGGVIFPYAPATVEAQGEALIRQAYDLNAVIRNVKDNLEDVLLAVTFGDL